MNRFNKNDFIKIMKENALFECRVLEVLSDNRIQVYWKEGLRFRSKIINNNQVIYPNEDKKASCPSYE